jgi:hypothetical protein
MSAISLQQTYAWAAMSKEQRREAEMSKEQRREAEMSEYEKLFTECYVFPIVQQIEQSALDNFELYGERTPKVTIYCHELSDDDIAELLELGFLVKKKDVRQMFPPIGGYSEMTYTVEMSEDTLASILKS